MEFYIVFEHERDELPLEEGSYVSDMGIFAMDQEDKMLDCLAVWAKTRMRDYDETATSMEACYSVFRGKVGCPKETWKHVSINFVPSVICTLA